MTFDLWLQVDPDDKDRQIEALRRQIEMMGMQQQQQWTNSARMMGGGNGGQPFGGSHG